MEKLEINLNLKIRIPETDLTVNGILQGLEEQTPVILTKILENIFRALLYHRRKSNRKNE